MSKSNFYIQSDSYFGEKSLEKNKEEIMESFIAGIACKLTDDLVDNPLLKPYRNKLLIETVKHVHTLFFTMVALKDSMFYFIFYFAIVLNSISNPDAYVKPYDRCVFYVFALLAFFVKKPIAIPKRDMMITVLFILSVICETFYCKEEYSFLKCLMRGYFVFVAFVFYCITTSNTLHYIMTYFMGYFGLSFFVQLYSVTKSKNKDKHSPWPWLNRWLVWLDDWVESWFVKGKAYWKTIHNTNK